MKKSRPKNSSRPVVPAVIITAITTALVVAGIFYFAPSSKKLSTANPTPTVIVQDSKEATKDDIIDDFVQSKYRVLGVVENKFAPYMLIIATKRSTLGCGESGDARCKDDTTCGSIYSSGPCYFFLEPDYVYGATPSTRFVGKWNGTTDTLTIASVTFKDATTIQFSSRGGDAGYGKEADWSIDITTGETSQLDLRETRIP